MEHKISNALIVVMFLLNSANIFAGKSGHYPFYSNQTVNEQIIIAGNLDNLFGKVKESIEQTTQNFEKQTSDRPAKSDSRDEPKESITSSKETINNQVKADNSDIKKEKGAKDVNSPIDAKHSPFGIPLSVKFSPSYFKKILSATKKRTAGNPIYVHPKETHPAFIMYSVALDDDGYIRTIYAKRHSHSNRYAISKAINFQNQQNCLDMSASIGDALINRYGNAKKNEVVNNGRMHLTMIDNLEISIDFRARCASSDKKTVFNMKISDAAWEKTKHQESVNKSQKEINKAKKANNVF